MHEDNCFVTLTYSDEHLPGDRSLDLRHFQLFMKRLRKKHGAGIRFYHCGEYGESYGRPHYHACLFNHDFADKRLWKEINDVPLYTSEDLSTIWGHGYCTLGSVTFQSAAYVARYIMKKITGTTAEDHYEYVDPDTGQIFDRKPEYTTMSRRPGIGRPWLDRFQSDVFPSDEVIINAHAVKPPKFYDRQYEISDPDGFADLRRRRKRAAIKHKDNNTSDRLKVREQVQEARLGLLPRNLDQ